MRANPNPGYNRYIFAGLVGHYTDTPRVHNKIEIGKLAGMTYANKTQPALYVCLTCRPVHRYT